jgi:flagellin
MSFSIQTNYASMVAENNLTINNNFQTNTIEQLTSGYRINSSGDDAAGLAVANGYRDNVAELTQGVMNANEGVSTLQIIDGGLSNISLMLDRMKTLATESATTTFTGNRATLDGEYQTLIGQINRQASTIGLSSTSALNATTLGVYIGGGQSSTANAVVNINLSQGKVDSGALGLAGTNVAAATPVTIGTVANGTISAGSTESFTVSTAAGSSTFSIVGQAGDTATTQLSELNTALGAFGISASLDTNGHLAFSSSGAYSISVAGAGLAGNGNNGVNTALNNGTFQYDTAHASTYTVTEGSNMANISLAAGLSDTTALASINSQLKNAGITDIAAVTDGSGTAGHYSLQSASTFTDAVTAANGGAAAVGVPVAASGAGNGALNAITAIDNAVQALGKVQGTVGAGENSLGYALDLANAQIANLSSAESQIRDADMAKEAANLTKAQVTLQASVAAEAQANSTPQLILKLLQS